MIKLNEKYRNDFKALWNREKGELFYVAGGHLQKMCFSQRAHYRLSSYCPLLFGAYAEKVASAVKGVIDSLTQELHFKVASEKEEKILSKFYFNKISSLSQRVYSRKLHAKVLSLLESSISTKELPKSASPMYTTAYRSAKLWSKLGNYQMLGGSSGSYRIFDSNQKNIGVCKLSDEEPLAPNNPRFIQKCKRIFHSIFPGWSQDSLFKTIAGQAYLAEAATWLIEQEVVQSSPLTLVPETHVSKISLGNTPEKVSSFQLWVDGKVKTASEFLGLSEAYSPISPTLKKIPDELFDYMVIIDYLTGNHDRHGENWFVLENDQGEAKEIRLIDGGWSMSPYHPASWSMILLRNQYLWKNLDLAKEKFTPKAIETIENLYKKRDHLESKIAKFYESFEENDLRAARVTERLAVLYQYRHKTKADLAKIRSSKDFIHLANHPLPCP